MHHCGREEGYNTGARRSALYYANIRIQYSYRDRDVAERVAGYLRALGLEGAFLAGFCTLFLPFSIHRGQIQLPSGVDVRPTHPK